MCPAGCSCAEGVICLRVVCCSRPVHIQAWTVRTCSPACPCPGSCLNEASRTGVLPGRSGLLSLQTTPERELWTVTHAVQQPVCPEPLSVSVCPAQPFRPGNQVAGAVSVAASFAAGRILLRPRRTWLLTERPLSEWCPDVALNPSFTNPTAAVAGTPSQRPGRQPSLHKDCYRRKTGRIMVRCRLLPARFPETVGFCSSGKLRNSGGCPAAACCEDWVNMRPGCSRQRRAADCSTKIQFHTIVLSVTVIHCPNDTRLDECAE